MTVTSTQRDISFSRPPSEWRILLLLRCLSCIAWIMWHWLLMVAVFLPLDTALQLSVGLWAVWFWRWCGASPGPDPSVTVTGVWVMNGPVMCGMERSTGPCSLAWSALRAAHASWDPWWSPSWSPQWCPHIVTPMEKSTVRLMLRSTVKLMVKNTVKCKLRSIIKPIVRPNNVKKSWVWICTNYVWLNNCTVSIGTVFRKKNIIELMSISPLRSANDDLLNALCKTQIEMTLSSQSRLTLLKCHRKCLL